MKNDDGSRPTKDAVLRKAIPEKTKPQQKTLSTAVKRRVSIRKEQSDVNLVGAGHEERGEKTMMTIGEQPLSKAKQVGKTDLVIIGVTHINQRSDETNVQVKPKEATSKRIKVREPNDQDVPDPALGGYEDKRIKLGTNQGYIRTMRGYPYQRGSEQFEAEGEVFKAREANNQDVDDPAIECRDAEKTEPDADESETDEEDGYPWFAARVVCYWLTKRMAKEQILYWNVDDYDGKVSHVEEEITAPEMFLKDREMTAPMYQQLRRELIAMEGDEELKSYEVNTEDDQTKMENTIEEIHELGDRYHQTRVEIETWRLQQWNNKGSVDTGDAQLACFTKGRRKRQPIGTKSDGEDDEDCEQMVCQMNGDQWESLPFPIIVDSGACASVMPIAWCQYVPTQETRESKAGEFFRAANGDKIYNEGKKVVSLMTREGIVRGMNFTSCEVSKALGSVSQICRAGHRVVFNPPWSEEGSYIEHESIGETMWMTEHNGLYVLNTKVAPTSKQSSVKGNTGFGRPANP